MSVPEAGVGAALRLLWDAESVFVARLDPDGTVLEANPTLLAWTGHPLAGAFIGTLLHAGQRPALERALGGVGDDVVRVGVAFTAPPPHPAHDRVVRMTRSGDEVLFFAEPAHAEGERLVEQVLELNTDLIATQRRLTRRGRELERSRAEAAIAADRVRRLEAIMLDGLTQPDLPSVLDRLLAVTMDVLGGDGAAVLLYDDRARSLVTAAATGVAPVAVPRRRVPLRLEHRVIGMLEVWGELDDATLLERVAERAVLAIGHAQLRERERAVAEALQQSVLPHALPEVAGVQLCGRYLARTTGVGVGGDFYDALVLDDGRLALSIGDVAGKGLTAASTMGRLCHAMRAHAGEGEPPGEVLSRLDGIVADDGQMATAAHLRLDPASGRLTYASAGHLPALRISATGTVTWLRDALSPPLGVPVGQRVSAATELDPGDRLLLFTDGLIERRGEALDIGLDRLAADAAGVAGVGDLCGALVDMVQERDGHFEDDVAVLAVEVSGGA